MSYVNAPLARFAPMGDDSSDLLSCVNKANASSQVSSIDAIIRNLNTSWNPTGYFRPADVQQVLNMLADEAAAAGAAVAAAPSSTRDAADVKAQAFEDMLVKYKDRSQAYVKALADARASNATAVNAPAFKSFVLAAMQSISDAYVTATVLECRQSWVEKWLDRAYRGMAAIGSVVARIGGIVLKAGEAAVSALDTAGSMAAVIIKYAPYAALGLGAYLLYGFIAKRA